MIFISMNSKKVTFKTEAQYFSFNGYPGKVTYKKHIYYRLYDECYIGDACVIEKSLKLKPEDLLVLRGGLEGIFAIYAKDTVVKKEGEQSLIDFTNGVCATSDYFIYYVGAGSELDMDYYTGVCFDCKIIQPDAGNEKKLIVAAANKLKEKGLKIKKIVETLGQDEKLRDAIEGLLLFDATILKELCGWK